MKNFLGLTAVLAVLVLAGCEKCGSCSSDKSSCTKEGDAKAPCGKDCTKPCCAPAKK